MDLKADNNSKKWDKKSEHKNSVNSGSNRTNSEAFSWRKKSGEGSNINTNTNTNTNNNNNYQNFADNKSFHSNSNSNSKNTNIKQDFNFKRERFNSEGNAPSKFINSMNSNNNSSYNSAHNNDKLEEIEIDLTNIKYSLTIKYKYSLQDMMAFYDRLNNAKILDTKPKFNFDEEDLISEQKKDVSIWIKRDRSNTQNSGENVIKTNSPNSEKRTSFSSSVFNNNIFEDLAINNDSTGTGLSSVLKIPRNNPLANIGNLFNKFDDPNL